MTDNIPAKVAEKLCRPGADKGATGRIALSEKGLFLAFVARDRAMTPGDFGTVLKAVDEVEARADRPGHRALVVFARMSLRFSGLTPRCTHAAPTPRCARPRTG